jgi:hypothetical protein
MKNDPSHAVLREADGLGHEARAGRGDHAVLRLWLRLLASTTQIENEVRPPPARALRHLARALRLHGTARPRQGTASR